ncbi:MAG TPA: SUMF1/EgtB/PvdO family nonheme iron enzyme [Motiliproteus sp.]
MDEFALDFSMLKKGLVIGPEHHQFRLIKPVSNSPIGQVWHADDLSTAQDGTLPLKVAVEIVNPKLLQDPQTVETFKAQVTHVKQLKHKHIAETYGYFQSREGWLFVAMEPVRTRSLARILMEDGYQQLKPEKIRIILAQIAQGIDFANKQKVSHGDLTPWNVIITPESGAKLVNFAFRQPLLQRIQDDGMRVLNSEYHAPEAFISVPLPKAVDIYSLACITYQLFSGFPPFSSDTPVEAREAEQLAPPRQMSEKQWAILKPALSAEPGQRPQSAVKLVADLFSHQPASKTSAPDSTEAGGGAPALEPATPSAAATPAATGVNTDTDVPKADSTLRIQFSDNHHSAPSSGFKWLTATVMFGLGLVIGYLVASNQYEQRDNQLVSALSNLHLLLNQPPSAENKVALSGYFAEVRSLSHDSELVSTLRQRVEAYKVRLGRDLVGEQPVIQPAQAKPGNDQPAPGTEQASQVFKAGMVFKDEILPDYFGPNMVVIPAGEFLMGDQDRRGDDNELPVHPVTIAKPFALSQHEVTFADYDLFALNTGRPLPSDEGWGRGNRPVINVSWNDANAYAFWLRKQTGLNYRLPTEAEWEYAARAGSDTPYWWGNDVGRGNANCSECGTLWDGEKTAPVGSFKPNPFGLYDLNGNVYEWVADCYFDSYTQAPADGSSRNSSQCSQRVMRGGSWYDISRLARSASRYRHSADSSRNAWGFRLALDLK